MMQCQIVDQARFLVEVFLVTNFSLVLIFLIMNGYRSLRIYTATYLYLQNIQSTETKLRWHTMKLENWFVTPIGSLYRHVLLYTWRSFSGKQLSTAIFWAMILADRPKLGFEIFDVDRNQLSSSQLGIRYIRQLRRSALFLEGQRARTAVSCFHTQSA